MAVEPTPRIAHAAVASRPGASPLGSLAVAVWQSLLFGGMALVCLYVGVMHFVHPEANAWYVGPLCVAGAIVAWVSPVTAVCGFIVSIPLVNGLTITLSEVKGNPYNVIFSGIFLAWFLKRVFVRRKSVRPASWPAVLADVFSTAVLCSLAILLLAYPRVDVFPEILRENTLNQYLFLYCVQAAAIIVQGVFLYRLLELESDSFPGYRTVSWVFLAIATIVVGFALLQFLFDVPAWRGLIAPGKRGLLSPLDDSNSFGSAVVLLFSLSLFMALGEQGRARIIHAVAALLLAWCAVFSLSRVTWVAMAAVAMAAVWQLRRKHAILITVGVLSIVVLTGVMIRARSYDIPFVPYSTNDLSSPASLSYRLYRWGVTLAMISDAPLSGGGVGSFLRLYPLYSHYDQALDGTDHFALRAPENAHNYFLQVAAELGLPALAVFLVLLICVCRSALFRLRADRVASPFVKGLMVGLAAYLLTCLTGHPLLLASQQFIFWFAIAAVVAAPFGRHDLPSPCLGRIPLAGFVALCAVLLGGYAYWAAELPGSAGARYGVYPAERWGAEKIEWTKKEAGFRVEATSDIIGFKVYTNSRNIGPDGLVLTIAVDGKTLERRTLFSAGPHLFSYYVPGLAGRTAMVQVSVNHTFNPRAIGLSQDARDLGVALAPITFLPQLPPDGVGFHSWETLDTAVLPVRLPERTTLFRWTQRQATIPLSTRAVKAPVVLLLCAGHPDVQGKPVSVEIRADGRVLRTVTLGDTAWKQIEIPAALIGGAQALTLRTDRTWNPRLAGLANDSRDLGVGVIFR